MTEAELPAKVVCPQCGHQQYSLFQYKDGKKRDITECEKCHFNPRRGKP